MSKAPRKIWYDTDFLTVGLIPIDDSDTPYIRADIVDELVESLQTCWMVMNNGGTWTLEDHAKARAAIAKAKGE